MIHDLIANGIGWGSVLVLWFLWRYAEHFENGNIERYANDQEIQKPKEPNPTRHRCHLGGCHMFWHPVLGRNPKVRRSPVK